ncbi:putative sialic acid transporter [Caballeronia hypogeia]|uniref:Sialic acid transporter n=1 Tax=Caballeronia hypogeia TaxID=1777140 RepID=A0A158CVU7_9BURK|nr:hypothetical protein [Caballeronia hypogeia]SAK86475.1 putative sialic acid transporter [Caballeronia hypogeia]
MASAIGQNFGFVVLGFIAERVGRRVAISVMIGLRALSSSNIALAAACSFASCFFLIGSSGVRGAVLIEHLPREVRASGVGLLYNFGVFGDGIAPFIVPSTMHSFHFPMPDASIRFTIVAAVPACS